jgi:hypothetical protein
LKIFSALTFALNSPSTIVMWYLKKLKCALWCLTETTVYIIISVFCWGIYIHNKNFLVLHTTS